MAKQVQLRRGTTAEHAAFTGVEGELTVDTTKDTLVLHDAYQAGGYPLLREDISNLADGSVGVGKITNGSANQVLVTNSAGNASVWSNLPSDSMPAGSVVNSTRRVITGYHTLGISQSSFSYTTNHDITIEKKLSNSQIVVEFFCGSLGHYDGGNSNPQWKVGFRGGAHSGTTSDYSFSNLGISFHASGTRYSYLDYNHSAILNVRADLENIGTAGTYYIRNWWTSETSTTYHFNRNQSGWAHNGWTSSGQTSIIVTEYVI